jgi:hypothetical protein
MTEEKKRLIDFELVNLLMLTENTHNSFGDYLISNDSAELLKTVRAYIRRIERQSALVAGLLEETQ